MAAMILPLELVEPANAHLLCGICKSLFRDPVISTACGHTYCRMCICSNNPSGEAVKCPIDGAECQVGATVPNRAVQSQIEDLEIYCKNGLIWSKEENQFVPFEQGCHEVIKIGSRHAHEDNCSFNKTPCPNNEGKCGNFPKQELEKHLLTCPNYGCPHKDRGCDFLGRQDEINWHGERCGYRPGAKVSAVEVEELRKSNRRLEETVIALTKRVAELESRHDRADGQLGECLGSLKTIESRYTDIHEKLDKLLKVQRSPSRRSSQGIPGTVVMRTPSTSSLTAQFWRKTETWTMPFQFKCIGTLRSHRAAVHALCTKDNRLFSAAADNVIKVWELDGLAKGHSMNMIGHTDAIQVMCMGERYIYTSSADGSIRAWNMELGEEEFMVQHGLEDGVVAMVCNSDFIFTSTFSAIHVWEADTLKSKDAIMGLHHWVRGLALNYGRDKLYSGSHNTIEVWDALGKFTLKGKINHNFGSIHCLAITSETIIAGTYNQNIQVFDVVSQRHLYKLSGHLGAVTSLQVSPSGRFLFSSSADTTIKIWNLENHLPIQSLTRHECTVNSIVLHGDLLLSGAEDTEIKVFKHFSLD